MKKNFEAAVQLLVDGRCDSISPEDSMSTYVIRDNHLTLECSPGIMGVCTSPGCFLGEWVINGYKPETETAEIEGYVVMNHGYPAYRCATLEEAKKWCINVHTDAVIEIVKLTGLYQRPVPAKIKHREEITGDVMLSGNNIMYLNKDKYPKDMRLFVEWQE